MVEFHCLLGSHLSEISDEYSTSSTSNSSRPPLSCKQQPPACSFPPASLHSVAFTKSCSGGRSHPLPCLVAASPPSLSYGWTRKDSTTSQETGSCSFSPLYPATQFIHITAYFPTTSYSPSFTPTIHLKCPSSSSSTPILQEEGTSSKIHAV